MAHTKTALLRTGIERFTALTVAIVLAMAALVPLLIQGSASAALISNRNVTITTSEISATADYDFEFDFAAQAVQGIIFSFCDDPLPQNTCSLPSGVDVSYGNLTISGQANFPANATAFNEVTADTGDCNDVSANDSTETMYCVTRSEATSGAGTDASLTLEGVTNADSETTIYIRIQLYTDSNFTTAGDNGTVAAAMVPQLTINGRVQERLEFCVAAVDDDDDLYGSVVTNGVSDCIALTDTNVDIGVIDESSINTSPVEGTATNGADDDYGILMVNTNAQGGVILSYFAEDPSSVSGGDTDQLKSFRVVPADCDASAATLNDQCFQSAANAGSGSTISAGTEMFGLYIPCVLSNDGTVSTTTNLTTVDADYDGSDNAITSSTTCEEDEAATNTVVGWNSGTTADTLISSSTVVDDEIVKVAFSATASATTPPGSYTVTTTYVATATF